MSATFTSGQVACGTTATQLEDIPKVTGEVHLIPDPGNTGNVYVGDADVEATTGMAVPEQGITLEMMNAHVIFCIGTDAGDILTWGTTGS